MQRVLSLEKQSSTTSSHRPSLEILGYPPSTPCIVITTQMELPQCQCSNMECHATWPDSLPTSHLKLRLACINQLPMSTIRPAGASLGNHVEETAIENAANIFFSQFAILRPKQKPGYKPCSSTAISIYRKEETKHRTSPPCIVHELRNLHSKRAPNQPIGSTMHRCPLRRLSMS